MSSDGQHHNKKDGGGKSERRLPQDVAEFVFMNEEAEGAIECVSVSNHTIDKMYKILETALSGKLNPLDQRLLLLDLHGVVDTVDAAQPLAKHPVCVISFLGRHSAMRGVARAELFRRLASGQIHLGIMLFERPKVKEVIGERTVKSHRGKIETTKVVSNHNEAKIFGSKAWMINLIDAWSPGVKKAFIDDGEDHLAVVREYCSPTILTRLLTRDMDIVKTIQNM